MKAPEKNPTSTPESKDLLKADTIYKETRADLEELNKVLNKELKKNPTQDTKINTSITGVSVEWAKLVTVKTKEEAEAEALEIANKDILADFTLDKILATIQEKNKNNKNIYLFNESTTSQLPSVITTLTKKINTPEKKEEDIEKIRKLINLLKDWDFAKFQKTVYGDIPQSIYGNNRNDSKIGTETLQKTESYLSPEITVAVDEEQLKKEKQTVGSLPMSGNFNTAIEWPQNLVLTEEMMTHYTEPWTKEKYQETLKYLAPYWTNKQVDFTIGDVHYTGVLNLWNLPLTIVDDDKVTYTFTDLYEVTPDHITTTLEWGAKIRIINDENLITKIVGEQQDNTAYASK